MKFENTQVFNFDGAIRGARNPMNSWDKSDSFWDTDLYCIGPKDMELAQKLIRGGSEHRKFLRQIFVSVDIVAPTYWWKDFDTYKIGTTANSTSTMHKLASTPICIDCFETDDFYPDLVYMSLTGAPCTVRHNIYQLIDFLESLRLNYLETGDKRYWKELVRWLPMGWIYRRTVTMSYENIFNIIHQRKGHKLNEWSGKDDPDLENFIKWARTLPYAEELLFIEEFDAREEREKNQKILDAIDKAPIMPADHADQGGRSISEMWQKLGFNANEAGLSLKKILNALEKEWNRINA